MVNTSCAGLVLDGSTLVVVNNIITIPDAEPTSAVVANCGGVQFDADIFKLVDGVVTDIDSDPETVEGFVVPQLGCGGVVLDSNCFELDENNLVSYTDVKAKYNLSRTVEGGTLKVMKGDVEVADGTAVLTQGDIISFVGTPAVEGATLDTFTINGQDADADTPLAVTEDIAIVAKFVAHTVTINFKINDVAETAEEGTTFGEWVASAYNANGYKVVGEEGAQKIVTSDGTKYVVKDNNPAKPSDEITEGAEYPLANV